MCEHKIPDCTRPPFVFQTFSQQPLSTWGQAFPPHLRVNFEFQIMLHNNRNLWKTWQGHVSSAPQVREHEPLLSPFSPRENFCNQRFDKDVLTKLWSSFSAHMWIIFLGFCLENLSLNLINWNMSLSNCHHLGTCNPLGCICPWSWTHWAWSWTPSPHTLLAHSRQLQDHHQDLKSVNFLWNEDA